jgi:serine/threonine-protein kinase
MGRSLVPGKTLIGGVYAVRSELGAGGMGVVYDAQDTKLDRRVAIKQMRPEIGQSARHREKFLAEARMVAKLDHPNIVRIHAVIEEGSELYLVFEYVDGVTLNALLDEMKRLSPQDALKVLPGIADALDHAHSQKVIHRDIKPSNVMMDRQGRVKVMDFGIAHQAKLTVSQYTMADAFGTYAYMPPEQSLGQAVRESDVYAFAAMSYEALTGDLPFPGPDYRAQKESMVFRKPSEAGISASLDAVFDRAFQPDPKKRFPTASEFLRTLEVGLRA